MASVWKKRNTKARKIWQPSLQGDAHPHAWIILPPRIEVSFRERWFSALTESERHHKTMRQFDAHWERNTAITDLKNNFSSFAPRDVLIPYHPFFFEIFLWRELQAYGYHLNRVVEINQSLRKCSAILRHTSEDFDFHAARGRLTKDLNPLREKLLDFRLDMLDVERNYWDKAFCIGSFPSTYEEDWDRDFETIPKLRPIPSFMCFPPVRQERNLDSIFQIRVGDLLRDHGRNPYGKRLSLLTISRLVLLVYICSELAFDHGGELIIWGSDPPRKLTVDRTYETLRDAGLR